MYRKICQSLMVRFVLLIILVMGALRIQPASTVLAATLTVTNTNDSGAGSLRQAIVNVGSGDTITFHPSLSGQTIILTSTLLINKNLTINGSALASRVSISGNHGVRVFEVTTGTTVTLNSLMLVDGFISGADGGGLRNSGTLTVENSVFSGHSARWGGGIDNHGMLTLNASSFSANTAIGSALGSDGLGGAIINFGVLSIANSTFSSNAANSNGSGGGIFNFSTLNIVNSNFSGNSARYGGGLNNNQNGMADIKNSIFSANSAEFGGGIVNYETLNIVASTLASNTSTNRGGGIYNDGVLTLTNSTFSNNSSGEGGGVFSYGTLDIMNNTLSGNTAGSSPGGGGISNAGVMNYVNTIIANSTGSNDCYNNGAVGVNTNNLVEANAVSPNDCGIPLSTSDPNLGPLANNGGPTPTMALLSGSPAINAGNDASCPDYDQRGVSRPQGVHCDIGAYEVSPIFADVAFSHWAYDFIERLYNASITGGCAINPLKYCPEGTVTRAQMAIFLERGIHGSSYNPPGVGGSTGFNDVFTSYWAAAWIKQLAAEGITGGCGPGNYCPESPVTRAQMAIFLLRSKHGASYIPPAVGASTGFGDVPTDYWAAAWIKQLVIEGITAGCGTGTYCPESPVTRAQMAVFLVRTFNLP